MNKDKEPLMSAEEWYYNQLSKQSGKTMSNFEIAKAYSKYHTEWYLNNVKEVVEKETYLDYYYDTFGEIQSQEIIYKQSITNAVDKYIEDCL